MCEFCVKHGEGKKWYLNAKNYSYDLLSDIKRKEFVKDHFYWVHRNYNKYYGFLKGLPLNTPVIGSVLKSVIKRTFIYEQWGQVIPIEDVEKILSFTNSITRVPCACRMTTTGKEHRLCFLISIDPDKIGIADIVDPSFFGGPDVAKFEKVDKEWVLEFMKQNEVKGRIHTVWALKPPFIGTLCNCDFSTGCIPMRMHKEIIPLTFRAEYIATVDAALCTGCGKCIKNCLFNAVEIDKKTKKAKIDPKHCYGCGICRSVCKQNAIRLIGREENITAAKLW